MANAFDITNLSVLTLLSYATDLYGSNLTLSQLADAIDADAEESLSVDGVDEQDSMLSKHLSGALSGALRELAENGYELSDVTASVTNLLDDEAIDEITAGSDEEEEDDDLEEEDDEEEEEDDEDSDDDDDSDDDLEEEEDDEDSDDDDDLDEEEEEESDDDEEEEDDDY